MGDYILNVFQKDGNLVMIEGFQGVMLDGSHEAEKRLSLIVKYKSI